MTSKKFRFRPNIFMSSGRNRNFNKSEFRPELTGRNQVPVHPYGPFTKLSAYSFIN